MRWELLYPSKYLKAADLQERDITLTIAVVEVQDLVRKGGTRERKPVMTFKGTEKMLVLAKTNAESVARLHGTETDKWSGKAITLYATQVAFGNAMVDAIRIRDKAPQRKETRR